MIEGLLLLLITIVLSIVGAAVASSLQHKAWEVQNRRSIEDAQLVRAQELSDKIVHLADRRIYRARRLCWSLEGNSSISRDRALNDYRESVFEWNDSFGYIRANLLSLYNFDCVTNFEEEIHAEFQSIGSLLERALRGRCVPSPALQRRLDVLSSKSYKFTARLKGPIRERNLPHFEDLDAIEYENADRLSSVYLVKRLYGISTKPRRI
ncbi:hypothetical protein [Amorphus sp. 3PC139-8]|uniref:hypothetical protein n=1 Tax=Amorphus sp. 3PC139-8 TaxID=2735676 RepID=UPI00345DFA54